MADSATTSRRSFRLGARMRKGALAAHIISAGAWLGIDATLGILAVTGLTSDDDVAAGAALRSLEFFAVWPMFTVSLVCLGTGVLLGIGTKYGVLRYWWVAAKLAINVAFSLLIVLALRGNITAAAEYGNELMAGGTTPPAPTLVPPVVVGSTLLLSAMLLSVFKPWGRIRRPARPARPSPPGGEPRARAYDHAG